MIEHDKYELLALFESEPKIMGEEEIRRYRYERQDEYGFTLKLYFSFYEGFSSLTLSHRDLKVQIFDLGFENVEKIVCTEDKLILQQTGNHKDIVVYFKPSYSLVFEDRVS